LTGNDAQVGDKRCGVHRTLSQPYANPMRRRDTLTVLKNLRQ